MKNIINNISESSPFIYIMLPTYNRPDLIIRAIRSVLSQKSTNFLLDIFNDGSHTDYSELKEMIKGSPNIRYHESTTNIGINSARNIMLREISEKIPSELLSYVYFCTLSDDDYFYPDAFEIFFNAIRNYPCTTWFCFNCTSLSENIFISENYSKNQKISYKKFRENYKGDKHFLFNLKHTLEINFPDRFFKNGYEHIFYFKVPSKIQVINKTVKVIEYQEDGLSLSSLYKAMNSIPSIIKHIILDPKNIIYYKWLFVQLSPKKLLKKILSEEKYYQLKKKLGLKVPDSFK